jgi:Zn-dependent peptidase ImmA (M78 family)
MDDKKARLILAHELGHLVYNIDRLEDHEKLNQEQRPDEEEKYAWEFAYYLIRMKSSEHEKNIEFKRFVYNDYELKGMLSAVAKDKVKPEIYNSIAEDLKFPRF